MFRDLKHAIRVLLQSKGWTAVVLVSLALGIGANTALFTAINGLMLQSVDAVEPAELVRISWYGENEMRMSTREYGWGGEGPGGTSRRTTFSYASYQALVEANETLEGLFLCSPFNRVNAVVDGQAEIASAFVATGNYFPLLGTAAAAGRLLTPADDDPAAPPAVVISHGYWARRFGSAADTIGRVIQINDLSVTIVGVTAPSYGGVQGPGRTAADIHLPIFMAPLIDPDDDYLSAPTFWWAQMMGRLKPGVTAAQVQGNLAGVFQAQTRSGMTSYLESLTPEERARSSNHDRSAVPNLLVDAGRRGVYDPNPDTRRDARVLGGVVLLVLLIVCANVANLLLSRAASRQQEIAIRLSIGATRWRLVRQLVTESVFLALLGGLLGLVVAYWARSLLPFGQDVPMNWQVFAFVALLSVGTGVVFGIVPALRATRLDLSASLKDNSRGVVGTRSWASRGLLVVQVAVSLVLLIGAGLFLNTLKNLRSVDLGFDATNLLLFRVSPALAGYDAETMPLLYDQMQERLDALPGVEAVSLSRIAFLSGSTSSSDVYTQHGGDEAEEMYIMTVSPEFFDTHRIPLLAGRRFDERDHADSQEVAIVNAAAARVMGGETAVGSRFGFSPEDRVDLEIVGVARDTKYNDLREEAPPTIFLCYRQRTYGGMMFELRTSGDPKALVPAVRSLVQQIEPNMPLQSVSTQFEQIQDRFRQERYFAIAYSWFGGLATLLAAIGLFGLASYNVAMRTNEIGVRMALGARRRDVVGLVMRESLILVGAGIVLGAGIAFAAGRAVTSLLYEVAPTHLPTMALAAVAILGVTAIAGYLPARRAARVDPMVALQYE